MYKPVLVWDGIVRLTHWVNALSLLLLLGLGSLLYFGETLKLPKGVEETVVDIHAFVGFLFAASLLTRIAYMLAGPEGASHWKDVVPHTQAQFKLMLETLRFYLHGFKGESPLYFAHNPLAGIAYTAFFLLATLQVLTGAAMYLLNENSFKAYAHGAEHVEEIWPPEVLMDVHALGALGIGFFIVAHLGALFLHDAVENKGLASSMISGKKFFTDEELTRLGEPLDKE